MHAGVEGTGRRGERVDGIALSARAREHLARVDPTLHDVVGGRETANGASHRSVTQLPTIEEAMSPWAAALMVRR